MTIEIIAIGHEILAGFTVNSNAAYISQALFQAGLLVNRHSVLPDNALLLKEGLKKGLAENTLVITTGGLGPTCDDLTRKVAAELFHSDFTYNPQIAAELRRRYGDQLTSLEDQATLPEKAQLLPNPIGTASGLIFSEAGKTLILLPGVPAEMRQMFTHHALPYICKLLAATQQFYGKRLHFFNTSESAIDPLLRQLEQECPQVQFGIYPSQGILEVQLTTSAASRKEAEALLQIPFHAIATQFSAVRFETASGKIEEALQNRFVKKGFTLSAAESCTGGSFSARLTRLPGASQYFLGSLVTYCNALKMSLLGVPQKLLEEKGAVSAEVAAAMCQGLLERTGSDYGVAVSGVAGPDGGTPEKPIGTVWCAVGKRGQEPCVWKMDKGGSREMIIERSVNALIAQLLIITQTC
jgi:nicotinamide-nucleotide amidase